MLDCGFMYLISNHKTEWEIANNPRRQSIYGIALVHIRPFLGINWFICCCWICRWCDWTIFFSFSKVTINPVVSAKSTSVFRGMSMSGKFTDGFYKFAFIAAIFPNNCSCSWRKLVFFSALTFPSFSSAKLLSLHHVLKHIPNGQFIHFRKSC